MSIKAIQPIEHPDVVIADTGPLVSLARAGALGLFHEIGGAVVIVDVVELEATSYLDKPQAAEIKAWIEEGQKQGTNTPIRREETTVGRLFEAALRADPTIKAKDAGENAIADWLLEKVDSTFDRMIVLYENGKVGRMIAGRAIDADIDVITTRAFLDLAERRHLIPSAQDVWKRIATETPTTNPQIAGSFVRRPPAEPPTALCDLAEIGPLFDGATETTSNFARAALLNALRGTGTGKTTRALTALVPVKDRPLVGQAAVLGDRLNKEDLSDDSTQLTTRIVKEAKVLPATVGLLSGLRRDEASNDYLADLESELAKTVMQRSER